MVSEKFRYQLHQEMKQWQAEGLIEGELYAQLAHRYEFNTLVNSVDRRFVVFLISLVSLLITAAAIAFLTVHWQLWSKELKIVSLLTLFASINATGFYLWRRSQTSWQTWLGKSLLLVGALLLGANLALMSQLFQQNSLYQLFLVWGLGVLTMAYSLRLAALGILATLLTAIGYSMGIVTLLIPREFSSFQLAIEHMPLLVSLLGIPLAYLCRSPWLFGVQALLIVYSLEVNLPVFLANFYNYSPLTRGMMQAIACVLPPAFLWAYRFPFKIIARYLALLFISLLFYWFSFRSSWNFYPYRTGSQIVWSDWLKLLDVLFLGGLTLWSWWHLGKRDAQGQGFRQRRWRLDFKSTLFGLALVLTAIMVWWHVGIEALGEIATLAFNLLLLLLAVFSLREGFKIKARSCFWGGTSLIVVQIVSRWWEYKTDGFDGASAVFLGCLVAIAAGLLFERYLFLWHARETPTDEK
jgi:uncharacterized membrane protein